MGFSRLVIRNFRRSPLRASMTVMTVAIMLAAFIFPRALVEAQEEHVRQTPNNRVNVRPKQGGTTLFPIGYADQIRELPGVRYVAASRLAGLRLPGQDKLFFDSRATEMAPFLAMVRELQAPAEQKQAMLADERGAFVSQTLAAEQGWKLGDRVLFESRFEPGLWEANIAGIFQSVRAGYAERAVWIHYQHFNRALAKEKQDQVNWIAVEIFEPNQGGQIAQAIDAHFDAAAVPSRSLEDRVAVQAAIGSFSAVLTSLDVVSYLILAVVMSLVGNTLAMNVRERTHEYGVMRAIGFDARELGLLVLAEAALFGLLGAALGLGLSYPLFEGVLTRVLKDAMNFPPIIIRARVAWLAIALGLALSLLAAAAPIYRVTQLRVTDALRRVG